MTRTVLIAHRIRRIAAITIVVLAVVLPAPFGTVSRALHAAQVPQGGTPTPPGQQTPPPPEPDVMEEVQMALIRLPLAAILGAALAMRPKRRGTPPRTPAVLQTQIILSIVGAVIMLVVGASLARAFGIVGAANLIRYRSKIDDPKDAVVMLCTLSVGLASGVGLYTLAIISTFFIAGALWVIESFENPVKHFNLKVKAGKDTDAVRPKIEAILNRHKLEFELRTSSDEEVCYDVNVPFEMQTDRVTNAILRLDPGGHAAVDWSEKKNKVK
jgi:uncharacterized membrane protein YhiD involved in acid resistance